MKSTYLYVPLFVGVKLVKDTAAGDARLYYAFYYKLFVARFPLLLIVISILTVGYCCNFDINNAKYKHVKIKQIAYTQP